MCVIYISQGALALAAQAPGGPASSPRRPPAPARARDGGQAPRVGTRHGCGRPSGALARAGWQEEGGARAQEGRQGRTGEGAQAAPGGP